MNALSDQWGLATLTTGKLNFFQSHCARSRNSSAHSSLILLCQTIWGFILYLVNLIFRIESIGHLGRFMEDLFCVNPLFSKSTATTFNHGLLVILLHALRSRSCLQGESQGDCRDNLVSYPLSRITVLHWMFSNIWNLFIFFFLIF